jgi:SAM-dependent methyltransferase
MTEQSISRPLLYRAWRSFFKAARYGIGPEAQQRKKADKAKRRDIGFFENQRWQHGEAEAKRRYGSYDEYLAHQASKLDKIVHRLRETEDEDYTEFKRRFEGCAALRGARSVLCLGARLGTEVRALHALGHFAIGVDLNPGADNPYVLPGDFHAIVFPDGSLDAVYTNALDHVFALDKLVGEVRRLLRPDGVFVVDLVQGYEEGYLPGEFEAAIWRDRESFIKRIRDLGGFATESVCDLGHTRRDHWTQAVFRKPASAEAVSAREPASADT